MPFSAARRERLQRLERLITEHPGLRQADLAAMLGIAIATVATDLVELGISLRDLRVRPQPARCRDLVMRNGLWCAMCNCGAYVPICQEDGDECPHCGLTLRVMVTAA